MSESDKDLETTTEEPRGEQIEEKPAEKQLNGFEKDDEKEAEDGDGDDEDDESSEEELGLLERPVEILSRKRDRKSIERYIDKSEPKKKDDELDYTQGKGTKLGDIEYVRHMVDKVRAEELKNMHRILFNKAGKLSLVKRNIRAFCGFPYEKDSTHYTKLISRLERLMMSDLKLICSIIGLEKGGDREAIRERLLDYLIEPKNLEKPIPSRAKAKKSKTPQKKKKKKSKDGNKKEKKPKETEEGDNDVSDVSEDSDGEKEEADEKPAKTPKKNTPGKKSDSTKKSASAKKKKDEKKKKSSTIKIAIPGKKSISPKKKAKTPEAKRKHESSDDSDDDDVPLVKKTKKEPTDDEVKIVVEEILKDADLEQVTMKTVCKQVYDRFPSFDLTPRKDFIKTTVKEIIS